MMTPLLLLLLLQLSSGEAFILEGDTCPVPCRCYSSYVYCDNKHLSNFPAFNFSRHMSTIRYELHDNNLTVIPERAFGNLSATGARDVTLNLQNNHIHSIHKAAFEGFGNIQVTLNLANNNLTYVPPALKALQNLFSLNVLGNGLIFIEPTVPSAVGVTLETLRLGMRKFAIWQPELSQFSKLYTLQVDQIQFTNIPDTAFEGLGHLRDLTISNSQLYRIPDAICRIADLYTFTFNGNTNLQNRSEGILPSACTILRQTRTLILDNNNMHELPTNLFIMFPSLTRLDIKNNYLNDIDSQLLHFNHSLQTLDISNNTFRAIPPVFTKLPALRTLRMNDNLVTHVGFERLARLAQLRELYLDNNPLVFVDPHAFNSNGALQTLQLERTSLTAVPAAILHMADRCRIYLNYSPISCSCDSLGFMMMVPQERVQSGRMSIYGQCTNSSESIKNYILTDVPDCL